MSEETIIIDLIETTCHVCLQNAEQTNWLHDDSDFIDVRMSLMDMLEEVVKMKCTQRDEAQHICETCKQRLYDAFDFIKLLENSERFLQNLEGNDVNSLNSDPESQDDYLTIDGTTEEYFEELSIPNVIENDNNSDEFENFEEFVEEDYEDWGQNCDTTDLRLSSEDNFVAIDTDNIKPSVVSVCSSLVTRQKYSERYTDICTHCSRSFAKPESLQRHIQRAHSGPQYDQTNSAILQVDTSTANQLSGIKCKYCPRTFKRSDTLKRHLRAFHMEEADLTEMSENNTEKKIYKRGVCPFCGISFPKSSLVVHIRRHTGENPYKCEKCDKGYPRRQDLIVHERMHTGERPSTCPVCAKSFISQNKLARHMRLHTGQRPYKCEICNKSFVQSNDLKIHLRRHTGERPYVCGICNERFICGAQLTTHRRVKEHYEPDKRDFLDPHENCRVNKRRAKEIKEIRIKRVTLAMEND